MNRKKVRCLAVSASIASLLYCCCACYASSLLTFGQINGMNHYTGKCGSGTSTNKRLYALGYCHGLGGRRHAGGVADTADYRVVYCCCC